MEVRKLSCHVTGRGGEQKVKRILHTGSNPERDGFHVPKSVQKSIPIKKVYKDGILQVSGKFSKTWRFFDVNYAVASPEKQTEIFMEIGRASCRERV